MPEEKPFRPASSGCVLSRRAIPPIAALRAFDAVARLGGVRKAAEAMGIDHAAISRQLKAIEEWTGAALFERSGKTVTLTETGREYHSQLAGALDAIAAATLGLIRRSDPHRIHISCMPGFAYQWLMPRLDSFRKAQRSLDIELQPAEALPDLGRYEIDVHIQYVPTYGSPVHIPSGLRSEKFAETRVMPVASPAYLEARPPIREASDLLSHSLIQERDFENWRAWFIRSGIADPGEIAGPRLWHGHLTTDEARRGHGIALSNHFLAGDDLAAGRLVEVEPLGRPFPAVLAGSYLFIAMPDCWTAPPVARFRRWLIDLVNAELGAETRAELDEHKPPFQAV